MKRRKQNADVDMIVINDNYTGDDVEMSECQPSPDLNTRGNIFFLAKVMLTEMVTQEYLCHILLGCLLLLTGSCSLNTICSLMAQLSGAEVSGDTVVVCTLLLHL
jgi:hypothetical protein